MGPLPLLGTISRCSQGTIGLTSPRRALRPPRVSSGPPEFEEELADCTAELGETVKLACRVTGTPKPIVSWYKGTCQGMQADLNRRHHQGQAAWGLVSGLGMGDRRQSRPVQGAAIPGRGGDR